jgi:hypothetical protein
MPFTDWETFYVIVGSSAAALTGLMFVVIAQVADYRGSQEQIDAFARPTIVHFGTAFTISVIMSAPWPAILGARIALGVCGAAGAVYTLIVIQRARTQTDYKPVFEDWLFHVALPLVGYLSLLVAASVLPVGMTPGLFVVGTSAVLLLFVGVHNAWDTVTYIVVARLKERGATKLN